MGRLIRYPIVINEVISPNMYVLHAFVTGLANKTPHCYNNTSTCVTFLESDFGQPQKRSFLKGLQLNPLLDRLFYPSLKEEVQWQIFICSRDLYMLCSCMFGFHPFPEDSSFSHKRSPMNITKILIWSKASCILGSNSMWPIFITSYKRWTTWTRQGISCANIPEVLETASIIISHSLV